VARRLHDRIRIAPSRGSDGARLVLDHGSLLQRLVALMSRSSHDGRQSVRLGWEFISSVDPLVDIRPIAPPLSLRMQDPDMPDLINW
jgi:hypothetical protein